MTYNNEDRTFKPPKKTNLPFFAYGIFKPGQLAYSKIESLVDEISPAKINYLMKLRDGVPILIDHEKESFQTKGFIITFNDNEKAYNIISNTLSKKLYKWKKIKIGKKEVNILFAVNPYKGSNNIEDKDEKHDFNGKNDPFFKEAISLVEKNLKSIEPSWNMEDFFKVQMNYMLLWSAIDRYSSLKYNQNSKNMNNKKFAEEKAFKKCIRKYKKDKHIPVYSAEDLKMYEFKVNDPVKTLKYYYTIRCNVVHRGKSMLGDFKMLKQATEELLEIFKEILNDTFNKSNNMIFIKND